MSVKASLTNIWESPLLFDNCHDGKTLFRFCTNKRFW